MAPSPYLVESQRRVCGLLRGFRTELLSEGNNFVNKNWNGQVYGRGVRICYNGSLPVSYLCNVVHKAHDGLRRRRRFKFILSCITWRATLASWRCRGGRTRILLGFGLWRTLWARVFVVSLLTQTRAHALQAPQLCSCRFCGRLSLNVCAR